MTLARVPRPLALLLCAGALLSIGWDVALPAFQGPDESHHFAYIQYLAETGELPSPTRGGTSLSTEVNDAEVVLGLGPLTGNLSARPAWSPADLALWHQTEQAMPPGSRVNGAGPNPIAKNPPLYYAAMTIPYRILLWLPLLKRLFLLRLISALCFLATITLTWLIAGEVFAGRRFQQVLAAGAVTLEPQLGFMSAVISADNLLATLVTAFLLAALRLVRRGPTMSRVLTATVLAAAACLTQGRGLVTVPVLAVALTAAWAIHRPELREVLARGAAAAGTLAAALVAYAVLGRGAGSAGLYGGQVRELNSGSFNLKQFLSSIYQFYFPKLPTMQPRIGPEYGYRQVFIDTFFGTFGSLEVTFKERIYEGLQLASAIGLVTFYTTCVARWRTLRRAWPTVAVLLTFLLVSLFFLHYVSYRALLSDNGSDPLIVGRYLLPMVSLFGLAIAFTLGSLPRRAGAVLGAAMLSAGLLLALGGIGITMARFYA